MSVQENMHVTRTVFIRDRISNTWPLIFWGMARLNPCTHNVEHCVAFLSLLQSSDMKMAIMELLSHSFRTSHTEQHNRKWWSGGPWNLLLRCLARISLAVWISGYRQTKQQDTHTHTNSFTKAIVSDSRCRYMWQHWPVSAFTNK